MIKPKKMVVVLEEMIKLPFRKTPESITRTYTVWAKTKRGAVSAVRNAHHKGKLVEVIVNS